MPEQVTCSVKGDALYVDCRCITDLRTQSRSYTREEAHDLVRRNPGALYVQAATARADIVPAHRDGLFYVRTVPNDTLLDNLLRVPSC